MSKMFMDITELYDQLSSKMFPQVMLEMVVDKRKIV